MANIYLTLDLKNHELFDEDGQIEYEFNKWTYDLKTKTFKLDNMSIEYDAIYEFKFDKDIKSDQCYVEIEDETVVNIDISNEYEDYLESTLSFAIENFIGKKDFADGEYRVKYTFYYDFSEEDFIVDVTEVIAND